jgi:hypothetical protein
MAAGHLPRWHGRAWVNGCERLVPRRGFLSPALRAWMGAGVARAGAIQARSASKGHARQAIERYPAQRARGLHGLEREDDPHAEHGAHQDRDKRVLRQGVQPLHEQPRDPLPGLRRGQFCRSKQTRIFALNRASVDSLPW